MHFTAGWTLCKHGRRACRGSTCQDSSDAYSTVPERSSVDVLVLVQFKVCTYCLACLLALLILWSVHHMWIVTRHPTLHCISPHHRHQQKWWKLHTSKYICPRMYSKGSQACVPRNGFEVCFLQQSVQHCETGGTQPWVSWPSDHRNRLQHFLWIY